LITSQCRVHPYELTGANISFIKAGGSPHAPPETSVTIAHAQPTRPEEEDDWSPRAPYLSRAEPHQENIPGSTPANRPTSRIGFLTGSTHF